MGWRVGERAGNEGPWNLNCMQHMLLQGIRLLSSPLPACQRAWGRGLTSALLRSSSTISPAWRKSIGHSVSFSPSFSSPV